jgi:hypothetical protein
MFGRKTGIAFLVVYLCFAVDAAAGLDYDANDFAVEVVDYNEGTGVGTDWLTGEPFNDANCALGRATLETTGDGWFIPVDENVPVVPVYPAFRAFELVTVGNGGQLIVKFNHPVGNDKNNPYGIDFIIYGNALQVLPDQQEWTNGNPEETVVTGLVLTEPGIVSVSQDGNDWYYFSSGPYADDFAATASYKWDDVNDVWAEELDPTRPVDPGLTGADFDGKTVAEIIDAYDGSSGGTGFDINDLDLPTDPNTGVKWIQYVRIDNPIDSGYTPEIDAFSDVSCCGDYKHPYPVGDLNKDCRVNLSDFAILAAQWLQIPGKPSADIAPPDGDGIVNMQDLFVLAENWLNCTWQCEQ